PAQDHDGRDHPGGPSARAVVYRHGRRRDEAHRRADGGRRRHLGFARARRLSGAVPGLEGTEAARRSEPRPHHRRSCNMTAAIISALLVLAPVHAKADKPRSVELSVTEKRERSVTPAGWE